MMGDSNANCNLVPRVRHLNQEFVDGSLKYVIPEAYVSKQNAIAALSEFRAAHRLISALQKRAMKRWSEQKPEKAISYADDELYDYRVACEHLLRSLELNPFNPSVHLLLANA